MWADTGLRPAQMSSAAFNPMTGVLYYVCCPSVGNFPHSTR